MYAM